MKNITTSFFRNLDYAFLIIVSFLLLSNRSIGQQNNIAPLATVTAAGAGAAGCQTGPCSTLNDLILGVCGTQQMWINTGTGAAPPSTVPGVDWIQWDFPNPKSFDSLIIHHGQTGTRFLTGATVQYWDGTSWVTHSTFSNLPNQCVNRVYIGKLSTDRFRITAFLPNAASFGQQSNQNFREIEIIEAPSGPNDAYVSSVDSPYVFCAGANDIYVTIGNYGINQINAVEVHWEVNGVSMPTIFHGQLLDTMNGNFPNTVQLLLGTVNLNPGNNIIKVWTANPNAAVDAENSNDTIMVVVQSAAPPKGLDFLNITTSSTDVNILGGTGSYEYEYGSSGFVLGTGTFGSINSSNFTISGLNPATSYDVYIRTNCGGGDFSAWLGPISFYTAEPMPYKQTFENFGTNLSGINNIEGWNNTASAAPEWETGTSTSSTGTGPEEDHTIGVGGTFAYLECSGGSLGDFDSLVSAPIFVPANTSSLTVEFWYHMHGPDMGKLMVYMDTNGVRTLIDSIVGEQHPNQMDPWLKYDTVLNGYEGNSVRLIFKGIRGNGLQSDMAVDDIRIMETPSCLEPTDLAASNITLNSADLSWTENNVSTQWEIEYGPAGFSKGTGTLASASNNPFTLSGLTSSTIYEFYVRSVCGRGDTSYWAGPFQFGTSIGIPFIEDFEIFPAGITANPFPRGWTSTTTIDPNWQSELDNGANQNSVGTGPLYDHTTFGVSGGIYMYMETSGGTTGDTAEFISPPIYVDTNITSLTLDYWYFMHGVNIDRMDVFIESNGVRTLVSSYIGQQQASQTDPWLLGSHILTGNYAGQMVQIIFSGVNAACCTGDIAIDDVRLIETPSCIWPTNLTATNITTKAVDIGWFENNVATQWEIEYDTAGFVQGTGTKLLVTTNPYHLTGLSAATSYDFYVRSICGRNDTSFWAGPFNFMTLFGAVNTAGMMPLPSYGSTYNGMARGFWFTAPTDFIITGLRVPTDIGLADQNIHLVKFSSAPPPYAASTSAFTTLGYWNGIPGATIVPANLYIQQGDIIGVLGTRGTNSSNSYATPAGPFQSTILGQPVTLTRLLFQGDIHVSPATDFSEEVNASLARVEIYYAPPAVGFNNAGVESVDSLLGFCAGPQDVYATIVNAGKNRIDSVEVHWEVNGIAQPMVNYSQFLDTINGSFSKSASILLGTANIIGGNNTIKVWTSMPNGMTDTVNINDTLLINLFSPSSPSGVDFSNIATTTVNASVVGAAGSIDFQYGLSSFTLGNGTSGSSASSTFNISGLSPNTQYDVYVRNNCGASSSSWAGPFTFRTAIAVPYLQDFENFGTNIGINDIEGWNSTSSILPQWETGTNTSSLGTGPAEDHTIGAGGTFVYLECSGGSLGDFDTLISPKVYVDNSITSLTLEFWYHMFGGDMGELEIYLDSNGVIIPIDTIVGQQQTAETDPWLSYAAHLPGYGGSTVRVIFKGVRGNGFESDMSIDDVRLIESPSCLKPKDLTVSSITATSADLDWTENNVATEWEVQYGVDGFTFGTGTSNIVNNKPHNVSSLNPNTTYEFYVRSICGRNDSSSWMGPFEFTTPCAPTTTLPYLQDFSTYVPICWKEANDGTPANGPSGFGVSDWYTDNFMNDAANGQGVGINLFTIGRNDWIISEPFDLSASVPQPYQLRMKVGLVQWASTSAGSLGSDDEIQLLISTDGGITWNNLYTWNSSNQPPGVARNISVSLASYTGTNNMIAIWASEGLVDDPEDNEFFIDDFVIRQTPTCLEPTNLTASNTTLTSADVGWTENNVATQWEIEYGPTGYTKGTGTSTLVSSNPYNITGLTSSTSYEFYVRSVCGRGDSSAWVGPFEFMTSIGVPFIEDFETFPPGITANPWPNGWTTSTSTDPNWESEDATGLNENSVGTGPLYDHTLFGTPGGIYMYMETSTGVTGDTAELVSAPIYIDTSISSLTLDYWYFLHGANIDGMDVLIESNGVKSLVASYVGEQQAAQTDPWLKGSHILSGYTGQSVRIIFRGVNVACCTGDIAVDDVRLIETPSCIQPSNLTAFNETLNTADIDWVENNVATQWEIEYGPTGYTQGAGNRMVVTGHPHTLTGLNSSTIYDYYVRSICGSADSSFWTGPFRFATKVGVPYIQDFENFGSNLSGINNIEGWNNTAISAPEWESGTNTSSSNTGPSMDHTIGAGGTFVYLESSGGSLGDFDSLISPPILVDNNVTSLTLDFWYHMFGGDMGQLEVYVDTNGVKNLITTIVGQQHTSETDPWTQFSTILTGYEGSYVQLIFKGVRGNGFESDMSVDDIRLIETPTCIKPTSLFASNLGLTSADLNWTEVNSASQWEIEYGPTGFLPGMGTTMIVASNPASVTGLNPSTTYDFYVRSICAAADSSLWTGPSQFTTLNGIPYVEDFETFAPGIIANPWPKGWTSSTSSDPRWESEDASGANENSAGTGPLYDHTMYGTPGGIYMYMETSGGTTADTAELVSPTIYVDPSINVFEVGYWYFNHGANIDRMDVLIESNGVRTLLASYIGQQQASQSDPWLGASHIITGYAGQSVQLVFRGVNVPCCSGDIAIDDVFIKIPPSINGALTSFVAPTSKICYSSTEIVTVELTNKGVDSLDFTVDSAMVTVNLTGAASQTISFMVNNNSINNGLPLAPFNTINIPVGTVDMTNAGTYFLDASLSIANDTIADDDFVKDTIIGSSKGSIFGPTSLCLGDSATLFASGYRGAIQWQADNGSGFADIPGATASSVKIGPGTSTQYRAVICGNLFTDSLTVNPTLPTVPSAADSLEMVFCGNMGVVALVAKSGNPNAKFEWYASNIGGSALRVGGSIYDISLNGDTLFFQGTPSLTVLATDTFHVQEIVISGSGICASARDSAIATIDCIVGIDENEENVASGISIYPNPSSGIFKVVGVNVEEEVQISIYNTNGKMVYQSENAFIDDFDERIDISGFAKGLYFVKLQTETNTEIKKIVIQ